MNRIRECRESRNLSQKQVAIDIGVAAPTVSQWESGIKTPSRESLKKLADLFSVTVDYLVGRSDDEMPIISDGLTDEESKLIRDYRKLNDQGKEYIRQTMYMALPIYIRRSDVSGMGVHVRG